MKRIALVDGLRVASPARLPGVPLVRRGRPDWTVVIDRGDPRAAPDSPREATGAIRGRGGTWAWYGRSALGPCVRVRPWFDLAVDSCRRRAVLTHARGAREDALVLRRALPYLGALSGRLVLHAACLVGPEGAVVLCADARTGKSTLALACDAAGLPVLGDDHVVLSPAPGGGMLAHACVPWIEVAPASVRAMRPAARGAAASREEPVRLRTPRPSSPVPVAAVCFLRRGPSLARRRLSASAALPRILRRFAFVGDPADPAEHAARFDAAARLVASARVLSLAVPEGLSRVRSAAGPALVRLLRAPPPGRIPRGRPGDR